MAYSNFTAHYEHPTVCIRRFSMSNRDLLVFWMKDIQHFLALTSETCSWPTTSIPSISVVSTMEAQGLGQNRYTLKPAPEHHIFTFVGPLFRLQEIRLIPGNIRFKEHRTHSPPLSKTALVLVHWPLEHPAPSHGGREKVLKTLCILIHPTSWTPGCHGHLSLPPHPFKTTYYTY